MHRACVRDEVESCPRVPSEEFRWEKVALQAIAAGASEDEIAGHVSPAMGERMDVVECGDIEVE